MSMNPTIFPGDRFGRLTVIREDGSHKKPCGTSERKYLCKCDCGNEISVLSHNLKSGNTKSCGCLVAEIKKNLRLPDNHGVIHNIILQYKRHARDRGLVWDLSHDQVKSIIESSCFYCGDRHGNFKVTKNCKEGYCYNGIDRIDSSKGYTIDNVVPCCGVCNKAKSNRSQKDFILWLQNAAAYTKEIAEQWSNNG